MEIIGLEEVKKQLKLNLEEGYDYDEALQFGCLAKEALSKGIEVPVLGKDYVLSKEADRFVDVFFSACDSEGLDVKSAYNKASSFV